VSEHESRWSLQKEGNEQLNIEPWPRLYPYSHFHNIINNLLLFIYLLLMILSWVITIQSKYIYTYIFITHRIISSGSHWIKLIKWYKIGWWISGPSIVWFYCDGIKAKKWASIQAKLLINHGKQKNTFWGSPSDGEIKKVVDLKKWVHLDKLFAGL